MRTRFRLLFPAVAAIAVVIASAGSAAAQSFFGERAALDLTPRKSYFKTIPYGLVIGATATPVFSPTTIDCPRQGNCLVQVLVHANVSEVLPGDLLQVSVNVSGQAAAPGELTSGRLTFRARPIDVDEITAHSHLWVAEVPPGTHVVRVTANTWSSAAVIGVRSLAITVLK